MAFIQSVFKNHCRTARFVNSELSCIGLKSLMFDTGILATQRGTYYYKILSYGRVCSFTSLRNRCLFTGRARAVIKRVHVGRHVFKKLASGGALSGLLKAAW